MPRESHTRTSIRWWPAAVILVLMGGTLAFLWLGNVPSMQHRVVLTFPTLFFGVLGLLIWLVLFSRLPGRLRLRIFLLVACAVGLGFVLVEIKGVSGNLVPILGWRWSGERTFGAPGEGVSAGDFELGGDFPQFYGPRRDARVVDPGLAHDWDASPPREIWRREVGEGWSSFAVVGDAAVTQELRGDEEVVVRYALTTGAQVWIHADHAPFNTTVGGSGPRATPTVVENRVYTLGATGILNNLALEDGRVYWSTNVLTDDGAGQPPWGMASSPLVVDDLVIVQLGRNGSALVAYDRWTGERVWRSDIGGGTYTTPVLRQLVDRPQVLVVNWHSVTGHDPTSGEILWRHDWLNPSGGERVTPPLVLAEDAILVSAGYGVGSRLLRLADVGSSIAVEQVWESRRLKSKFASMVELEGTVYGLDDGVLTAIDPATGERRWKAGRYGHGQILLVGDLLLIQAEDGRVVLVQADPSRHRELSSFQALEGKTWNPPALSGRLLLVRNNRHAACYELPLDSERGRTGG